MSKLKKVITCCILAMTLCIVSVMPAFAAEVWYSGQNYYANYTFHDTNLTPYKEIANSGTLVVGGSFYKNDQGSSNIKLTVEIRDYSSGRVLARTVVENSNYPYRNDFLVEAPVSAGQKIQLFFDASSVNNPPGFYRSAYVDYTSLIW